MAHAASVQDARGSTQPIMVTDAGLFGSSDLRTPGALTLGYGAGRLSGRDPAAASPARPTGRSVHFAGPAS
jgi:hypothetical protein